MDKTLVQNKWNWYPYTKPQYDIKHICVSCMGVCKELVWDSRTCNWYDDKGECIAFNGMYTTINLIEKKKMDLGRVAELIGQRDSLAKHLLYACDGFIEDMHDSPYVLPYDILYGLCKKYDKKKKNVISVRL